MYNPSRYDIREYEQWLDRHVGNYETVERYKRKAAFVIRKEARILRDNGSTGVVIHELNLRQSFESRDDAGYCKVGTIDHDPPGRGTEIWLNYTTSAMQHRRIGAKECDGRGAGRP